MRSADIEVGGEYAAERSTQAYHDHPQAADRVRVTGPAARGRDHRGLESASLRFPVEYLDRKNAIPFARDTLPAAQFMATWDDHVAYLAKRDAEKRAAEDWRAQRARERAETAAKVAAALTAAGVEPETKRVVDQGTWVALVDVAPHLVDQDTGEMTAPLADSLAAYVRDRKPLQVDPALLLSLTRGEGAR